MAPSWAKFDPHSLLLLGIGLAVIGIVSLLSRRLNAFLALAISTGVASAAVYAAEVVLAGPRRFAEVGLTLGAINSAVALLRTRGAAATLAAAVRALRLPATQAGLCLMLGVGLLAVASVESEPVYDDNIQDLVGTDQGASDLREMDDVNAVTDRGRRIPLLQPHDVKAVADARVRVLTSDRFQLIRTTEIDPYVNCHGWVFTMGRGWLSGRWVDSILDDNGYAVVDIPQSNDVVVYRGGADEVLHTAVVRATWGDRVLVESKWGALGTYLHLVGDTCYGADYKFYRTSRPDHLLRGLPRPSSSSAVVRRG